MRIEILQNRRTNRPNGDGYVYFNTKDEANEAMKCDRKFIGKENSCFSFKQKKKMRVFVLTGNRYVELYFDSPRTSSSNHHRSKSNDSPHRSPSKPKTNHDSRSRSMFFLIK